MQQHGDAHPVHGHDVGGRRGAGDPLVKASISSLSLYGTRIPTAREPRMKKTARRMKTELYARGITDARVLGLASGHGDIVGPGYGECGDDRQRLGEAVESANIALGVELGESAGFALLPEPGEGIVLGISTDHDDEGEDDEPNCHEHHLSESSPELGLLP